MSRACMIAVSLIALFVHCILMAGCAQNTEATSPQRSEQVQQTPTLTAQDQMTAGSDVRVYIINAPGASGLPDENTTDGDPTPNGEDDAAPWVTAPGTTVGKTNAGYAQSGIVVNITTGGTTPTATGNAASNATAGQTPSQNQTVSPVQDIKPEVTAAAPITVGMPGSATSGNANVAGSGGQMGDPQANPTQTPTWTQLRVPANYAADAIALLKQFFDMKAAGKTPVLTSQPE